MFYSRLNLIALNIHIIYLTSPLIYKRARSSTSIVNLVTTFYLVTYYTIGLLNKLIKKPCKLRRVKASLVKLVLEAAFRT